MLENVDRLIRSPAKQPGRDFSIILRCLYEKGYAVEWRVINAAEYGYAQRRRRTFIIAYHDQTEIFRNFAEVVCVQGLKSMHKHIMENGILAKAFPVQSHSRSYVENWIDELEYADISTVSRNQRVYLYNAGVMMNGRIYSVGVTPQRIEATPLKDMLETGPVDEHYFLRTEDMPRWTYSKGAKREKNGSGEMAVSIVFRGQRSISGIVGQALKNDADLRIPGGPDFSCRTGPDDWSPTGADSN